ncbi:hypothetical protein [Yoonia sp. R2-816]|uniref:hypothetical protein n=1 Tax=Yoonia sp. R2-816 TaxID=3342638 RepID=UPI00372B516F
MNKEPFEPIKIDMTLDDWRAEDGSIADNPISTKVSLWHNRIDLFFEDGRAIWIEQKDGVICVHGYLSEATGHVEPANLYIERTKFKVSADLPDAIYEHTIEPEVLDKPEPTSTR